MDGARSARVTQVLESGDQVDALFLGMGLGFGNHLVFGLGALVGWCGTALGSFRGVVGMGLDSCGTLVTFGLLARPYLLRRLGVADSWELSFALMERAHLAVTPGRDFGTHAPGQYLRFSTANAMEQLQEAVARLRRLLG